MATITYDALEQLGRERLSPNFYLREFLYSEIANWHQIRNVPDFPAHALMTGARLCHELLEPLQETFGRVHVRSGYRSPEVNAFGNANRLDCASNEKNYGAHIWDYPDKAGHYGAMACIVIPVLEDFIAAGGSWTAMAWWVHDHLPYSSLCFFSRQGAFNIGWSEVPKRRIDSYTAPRGCLTQAGMANNMGSHEPEYRELLAFINARQTGIARLANAPYKEAVPASPSQTSARAPVAARPLPASQAIVKVFYRAVHAKTRWRPARGHKSLDSAIYGTNGAAALFAGRVRTDYALHGKPLFALIWQDGDQKGVIIRPSPTLPHGIELKEIPISDIEQLEDSQGPDRIDLNSYFDRAGSLR